MIATLAIFHVLSLGLIGLLVPPFWTTVAMAVTLGSWRRPDRPTRQFVGSRY